MCDQAHMGGVMAVLPYRRVFNVIASIILIGSRIALYNTDLEPPRPCLIVSLPPTSDHLCPSSPAPAMPPLPRLRRGAILSLAF